MSIAEALKPKGNSEHLSMIVNAEGKIVQAEKREDEEQAVKQQEIIDLLFAAGYFRARIKGLSAFDKVVGGMTWCIDSFDMDIDVDLLFQDNLTIGQKIALTEKIVAVLPKMKCPHRIEPHQIQGLDFIHIYPVIQWLVKHSMERRKELGDYYKSYAVKLFDKMYPLANEKSALVGANTRDIVANIQEKYRPQRNFRRTGGPPADIRSRVESTLFEYGHFPSVSDSGSVEGTLEARQVDEVRSKQLMDSMASMSEQENRLAAGLVGSIVSMQADEIAKAVEHYTELQTQTEMNEATQLQRLKDKEISLLNEKRCLEEKLVQESDLLEKLQSEHIEDSPSHELTEAERGILKKLQKLIATNDSLQKQEQEFREQCKTELNNLKLLISEAEESDAPDGDTEEISRVLEELTINVANTRLALGRKNRAVASLQRQLDQVPTRAELAQYQRRFMELYSQVSAKHRETKQFFTLYNTLNDTNVYLGKELDLLTSISDNYLQAMTSEANKSEYTQQIEKMIKVIESIKLKVSIKLEDQRRERDLLTSTKLELVEQGRQCVAAYKQAGIEATNNENLLNQLKNLTNQSQS